ncbi:MAG: hypothetical protein V2B15_19825 [Bacteroidota bacterium]
MKIDNQRNTYRIWIRRLIMAILFTFLIILMIFIPWFEGPGFWLTEYHVIILIAVIYVVINVMNSMKSPNYISYSDHGEMILFRYYPLNLFNSKKNSIEIPKQQFVKYELKKFYFGRKDKIILYQNFRNRIVSYPPISLSALEEEDKQSLLASLQKYTRS